MAGSHDYRTRVTVSVRFKKTDSEGIPNGEQSFAMSAFEDSLADMLTEGGRTYFAAVITTDGRRDFVFYSRDPHEAEALARQAAESRRDLAATVSVEADPGWTTYVVLEKPRN